MNLRIHAVFALFMTAVVAATVAWGFVLVGSPAHRRIERIDERRLHDLQAITREIRRIVLDPNKKGKLKEPLPATLEEAAKKASFERLNLHDPESGEPYVYTVKGESTFELCATFAAARESDSAVFWNHPAGPRCFTVDVLDKLPD